MKDDFFCLDFDFCNNEQKNNIVFSNRLSLIDFVSLELSLFLFSFSCAKFFRMLLL